MGESCSYCKACCIADACLLIQRDTGSGTGSIQWVCGGGGGRGE